MQISFALLFIFLPLAMSTDTVTVIEGTWNTTYENATMGDTHLTIYRYNATAGNVVRIVLTYMTHRLESPLQVVVREHFDLWSVQLPIEIEDQALYTVGETLCPFITDQVVDVELRSLNPVHYRLETRVLSDFQLQEGKNYSNTVAVGAAVFYEYQFTKDDSIVNVIVESDSLSCMTVSVQGKTSKDKQKSAPCPVFDHNENVKFRGIYQTVTTSGSIPVSGSTGDSFYLVFVAKLDSSFCNKKALGIANDRDKQFSFKIVQASISDELSILFAPLIMILVILFLVYIFSKMEKTPEEDRRKVANLEGQEQPFLNPNQRIRRIKYLKVSDLSTNDHEVRNVAVASYWIICVTVAIFYFLPAVQFVVEKLKVVQETGNLDQCWYNYRCAKPKYVIFPFFAFNNIISNVGYLVLGLVLIYMTWLKQSEYKELVELSKTYYTENVDRFQMAYGLPQHPGISYSIGFAVFMEGIFSAAYHVCPSAVNFQFDTTYMYIIGTLGIIKIYQLRHPDIIAHAAVAFSVTAITIIIAFLGIHWSSLMMYIIFAVFFFFAISALAIEYYFKGDLNCFSIWRGRYEDFTTTRRWRDFLRPEHKGRFRFLLFACIVNLIMIGYGVLLVPSDFASYMLLPLIGNLFLYMMYYIVMKFAHGERPQLNALLLLPVSAALWAVAVWFFNNNVADWKYGPAQSRQLNKDCIIFGYYDNHDVWHFFSSIAIFVSFTLLDRIDDDLRFKKRTEIAVF